MELLDIGLRRFATPSPDNRTALLMHLEHMTLCFLPRIAEYFLKHARDVGHEVHRIVVDHHIPRRIERRRCLGFLLDEGRRHAARIIWPSAVHPGQERERRPARIWAHQLSERRPAGAVTRSAGPSAEV